MNKRENDREMQQMADEGWQQMKELLRGEGLAEEKSPPFLTWKKMQKIVSMAAVLLLGFFIVTLFQSPSFVNNKTEWSPATTNNSTGAEKIMDAPETDRIKHQEPKTHPVNTIFFKTSLSDSRIRWVRPGKENSKFLDSIIRTSIQRKELGVGEDYLLKREIIKIKLDQPISGNIKSVNLANSKPVQKKVIRKVQWYVGAASNISATNKNISMGKFNIHPSLRIEIPLNRNLNLHTGIYAFSAIHAREAHAEEKEVINNLSANLFYKINTTSIIKAMYLDVPVAINYNLSENWSLGAGVLFSKLLRADVKEKEESFDYNDNLIETSTLRYNSNQTLMGASSPKKIDIKDFDPRISVEGNFKKDALLFSVGYYYGLNRTITLQESNGDKAKYRNQYLKFGVQYQWNKKK